MSLWTEFRGNVGLPIGKWEHFFEIYDRHFTRLKGGKLLVWEIGVAGGGSSHLWRSFLGPRVSVVGLDINPECKAIEGDSVHVRIGSQTDISFLVAVLSEFGVPDIVVDDGSHVMSDIITTFDHIYPLQKPNSFYAIEDLHTAFIPAYGGGDAKAVNNVLGYSKLGIDSLYKRWAGCPESKPVFDDTYGIYFYDSLVIYEKGSPSELRAPVIGSGYQAPR